MRVIRPVKALQSHDTSKEALCVFGDRANSCIFHQTRSEAVERTWRVYLAPRGAVVALDLERVAHHETADSVQHP